MIQDVTPSLLDPVREFLESHLDTSIFLLHCLDRFGPRLGEHRDSGNYRAVIEGGRVVAVSSGTRRGHLLVQTGGRRDLAEEIVRGHGADPIRIDGVVAEWDAAESIWSLLRQQSGFDAHYEEEQVVYRRLLDPGLPGGESAPGVRLLGPDDFEVWYPLFHALELAEGASIQGDRDEVRRRYAAAPWRWWGLFAGPELAAVACVDVTYRGAGHLGGLYVRPVARLLRRRTVRILLREVGVIAGRQN
jgi:hypothetical protein